MEIGSLIKAITPHYNLYRKNRQTLRGKEALELFWEVGDVLVKFVEQNKVKPHSLYRIVYGKSEGKENITQKSYITRDFLSRAYRIRNIFNKKDEIARLFPGLQKFNLFYKAMPFIDNPKYAFGGAAKSGLYKLLNSNKSYTEILKEIKKLQKEKIGIKNPRTQQLVGMEEDKEIFIEFYNYIFKLIQAQDYKKVFAELGRLDKKFLKVLSQNTGAISADGLKMYKFKPSTKKNTLLVKYAGLIVKLIAKDDPAERRRFRRLIPPERMLRLSEMLYALTDSEKYQNYKL